MDYLWNTKIFGGWNYAVRISPSETPLYSTMSFTLSQAADLCLGTITLTGFLIDIMDYDSAYPYGYIEPSWSTVTAFQQQTGQVLVLDVSSKGSARFQQSNVLGCDLLVRGIRCFYQYDVTLYCTNFVKNLSDYLVSGISSTAEELKPPLIVNVLLYDAEGNILQNHKHLSWTGSIPGAQELEAKARGITERSGVDLSHTTALIHPAELVRKPNVGIRVDPTTKALVEVPIASRWEQSRSLEN